MNQMQMFMSAASVGEKQRLAALAKTTIGTLHQIAGSYRSEGVPQVRSGLAGRIQNGVNELRRKNKNLPTVLRTDLSAECRECEYAQRCLKGAAVVGEFQRLSKVDDLI